MQTRVLIFQTVDKCDWLHVKQQFKVKEIINIHSIVVFPGGKNSSFTFIHIIRITCLIHGMFKQGLRCLEIHQLTPNPSGRVSSWDWEILDPVPSRVIVKTKRMGPIASLLGTRHQGVELRGLDHHWSLFSWVMGQMQGTIFTCLVCNNQWDFKL